MDDDYFGSADAARLAALLASGQTGWQYQPENADTDFAPDGARRADYPHRAPCRAAQGGT